MLIWTYEIFEVSQKSLSTGAVSFYEEAVFSAFLYMCMYILCFQQKVTHFIFKKAVYLGSNKLHILKALKKWAFQQIINIEESVDAEGIPLFFLQKSNKAECTLAHVAGLWKRDKFYMKLCKY